ncbi:hypothetical protein EVAR_55927_1 [Eumeta japonica]|uniref:Uncharacterized protein n=1 Tax=Eumeta variegata TaxID=151549 RepID=A0A4C1YZR9_EUMVA|nr:hypothetical protein EVAR_55927_1 [Eumeta japonica]
MVAGGGAGAAVGDIKVTQLRGKTSAKSLIIPSKRLPVPRASFRASKLIITIIYQNPHTSRGDASYILREGQIMSRKKKISEEEAKLKKKEYDRKRREKMKSDPVSLEVLRGKERVKYLKKREKGQVKLISTMSSREKRQKRKNWKKNSQTYRYKTAKVRKNLAKLLDETPHPSSGLVIQNNNEVRNLAAIRRRQQLRRRTAIFYSKISRLQERLNREIRNKEKYRKRCQRLIKNNQTSPEAKVSALLKNIKVPEVVRKKLILSEVLTKQLKDRYINLKKHVEKKKYFEIIKPDLLKKHKLLHLSKPFFRHGTYKKTGTRKINAQFMKVKKT